MKHIDKYVLKRFLMTMAGTLFLLVVVLVLSELSTRSSSIMKAKADPKFFYEYLIFRIPRFISFSVPVSIMFSITFTITSFARTNELLAIIASGWSYYRAIAAALLGGVFLGLGLFAFNELIVGDAEHRSQQAWRRFRGQDTYAERVVHKTHIKSGRNFYYFHRYEPTKKRFNKLHVIRFRKDYTPFMEARAAGASYIAAKKDWELRKGSVRYFDESLNLVKEMKFKETFLGLPEKPELFQRETRHPDAMDLDYLTDFIPQQKEAGLNTLTYEILFQERFAIPFVSLVVLFIGALVGRRLKKASMAASLGITILVVLVYFVLQSLGKSFAKDGLVPVWTGVWFANILYTSLVILAFTRDRKLT